MAPPTSTSVAPPFDASQCFSIVTEELGDTLHSAVAAFLASISRPPLEDVKALAETVFTTSIGVVQFVTPLWQLLEVAVNAIPLTVAVCFGSTHALPPPVSGKVTGMSEVVPSGKVS